MRSPGKVVASAHYPAEPLTAARARLLVRQAIAPWVEDAALVDTTVLLVSELVTNAVVHGGSRVSVVVSLPDEGVQVAVSDEGPGRPERLEPQPEPSELVDHGRGLELVRQLSDDWGVEPEELGKTVWFDCRHRRAPTRRCAGPRAQGSLTPRAR